MNSNNSIFIFIQIVVYLFRLFVFYSHECIILLHSLEYHVKYACKRIVLNYSFPMINIIRLFFIKIVYLYRFNNIRLYRTIFYLVHLGRKSKLACLIYVINIIYYRGYNMHKITCHD